MNPVTEISLSAKAMADLLEAVVERGVPFRFTATGSSMNPSIRNNDVVTISPTEERGPRAGQVVAFRETERERLVVHRLMKKRNGKALIKGDNSPDADGWVGIERILGLVTAVERKGRRCFWPWSGSWAVTSPLRRKILPAWHLTYRTLRKLYRALR